ncbi:MAG: GNAT family N-acetyltransferase [Ignavibacteria bacterium]|nr:GNAT family N-acetyltransferase [Ignavibacteria bacterium]
MIIRKIQKKDSPQLQALIVELAEFEKLTPPNRSLSRKLVNDIFSKNSKIKVLVAENKGTLIGYAFYFFTYSTFLAAPTLYLEDIYVKSSYRKAGVGKKLFGELIKIAKKEKCGRIEFIVLDWNKNAMKFYEKFGVKNMKDWKFFRMEIK